MSRHISAGRVTLSVQQGSMWLDVGAYTALGSLYFCYFPNFDFVLVPTTWAHNHFTRNGTLLDTVLEVVVDS